jgi:hypothetical protein
MRKGLLLAILAVFLCGTVKAQEFILSKTNETALTDTYARELGTRGTAAYINGFGYPSMNNWIMEEDIDGYGIHADVTSAGKSVMRGAIFDSLRETAANMPVALEWKGRADGWKDWFENLFAGTVGNTAEGDVRSMSSVPSADETSYWRKLQSAGNLSYGFRPLEGNPYVYMGTQWGHSGDNPAAVTLVRWHYDPLRLTSKIDAQISFPLPGISQLSVGTSFSPEYAMKSGFKPEMSVRWIRAFGHSPLDGNCFIGAMVGDNSRIDAGLNFPW